MSTPAPEARSSLVRAFLDARVVGDREGMADAALSLPSDRGFGTHPGQVPAMLHEAYVAMGGRGEAGCGEFTATRARLAIALARAWAYGGDPARAVAFADDAEIHAAATGDPALVAAALDAALLVRWGPDDFSERLRLAARLVDVASSVADADTQLTAHLWRLTTAWECLDVVAVGRQLRALDLLAEDSGSLRVAFFAASRRTMHALVVGSNAEVDQLVDETCALGEMLGEPDVDAVMHSLVSERARRIGDLDTLRVEAAAFESFGTVEGIASVLAQAAVLWLAAGEPDRASSLAERVAAGDLGAVPHDVDFLLTVSSIGQVAAATGGRTLAADASAQLAPYAGRAVINAGAVTFHGVVDDTLYRLHRASAGGEADRWRDAASSVYRRIGATSWLERMEQSGPARSVGSRSKVLRRTPAGLWEVGDETAPFLLPDLKGLAHLSQLLARPGVPIGAHDLADVVAGHPLEGIAEGDLGPTIDRPAAASYRARLAELDDELDETERWADSSRREAVVAEREMLLAELRTAAGLGGRSRPHGATDERARLAVRKAINAAIGRMEEQDAALGRLLRDTVHTGHRCHYDPDPGRPVDWVLD